MNILLVWPIFPKSYWSFEKTLELFGQKAFLPPLGIVTVAALFPQSWNFRLVDKNLREITKEDWDWADAVMLSSMIVQKDDFLDTITEARKQGLPVIVGGPYVTSVPEDAEAAGADYIVRDEGEITIPMMLEDFEREPGWRRANGEQARRYTAMDKKPDLQQTPIARFDLLDMNSYHMMTVQYSRGCPFLCEFCDIINLYGRVPRTKPVDSLLTELQKLYDLGWRGGVLIIDDNFIGNKRNVKALLHCLRDWNRKHNYPFFYSTEASVDLAGNDDLLDLMIDCNFSAVLLGIETPDVDSLVRTRKHQNNRGPMSEAVNKIQRRGLRVLAGLIIGFDGEKTGAGDRIVQFVENCNITHALLSMLQVLPNTGLFTRLQKEGRLTDAGHGTMNTTTILNFVPTRPTGEIVREFLGAMRQLFDPVNYVGRVYRHIMEVGLDRPALSNGDPGDVIYAQEKKSILTKIRDMLFIARFATRLMWLLGVKRSSRRVFWQYAWSVRRERPHLFLRFLVLCALNEHFIELTDHTAKRLEPLIPHLSKEIYVPAPDETKRKRAPVITSHQAAE